MAGLCGSSFHLSGRRRERHHPSSHPPTSKWRPTRAVVLQPGGHLLRGRLIPERAAGPRLAAGGLKAAGHPGILAGAGGTLFLGEGEASGEWNPKMAAPHKGAAQLSTPKFRHKSPRRRDLLRRNYAVQTQPAEGCRDQALKALF